MKRSSLLAHLRRHGCYLKREGRAHSLWTNPQTGQVEAVRAARGAMGLTIREAAGRARVGKRFVLELEQGKPSARLDKVLALMAAVNLLALIVPLDEAMAALGPKR